jgi:hypothetical protein
MTYNWTWCALALSLAACGSGGASSESCSLTAQVSGGVAWSFADNPACLIPFGGGSGIDMQFRPIDGEVQVFEVDVSDVKEGQTGSFPATVEVLLRDGRRWKTARTCTVVIDSHVFEKTEEISKAYLASGSGSCKDPAMPLSSATGTVAISPFTFRFPPRW